ncbi:MAG: hypothetical protein LZF60_340174 [Nitrospira sp.]|nr:MAG: hypothetical protein LZF60_340174 [Nitrospira sp.]
MPFPKGAMGTKVRTTHSPSCFLLPVTVTEIVTVCPQTTVIQRNSVQRAQVVKEGFTPLFMRGFRRLVRCRICLLWALKTGDGVTYPRVQISPPPP